MNIVPHRVGRPPGRLRVRLLFASLLLLWLPTNTTAAEPSLLRGVAIANACATCHGPDGRSHGAIPSINSLSKENFMTVMRAFQTGERQGTVMNRIATGLDGAEIEAVAAYFVNLGKQ